MNDNNGNNKASKDLFFRKNGSPTQALENCLAVNECKDIDELINKIINEDIFPPNFYRVRRVGRAFVSEMYKRALERKNEK